MNGAKTWEHLCQIVTQLRESAIWGVASMWPQISPWVIFVIVINVSDFPFQSTKIKCVLLKMPVAFVILDLFTL